MHVFKATFPGTQAQADYIEHALRVIEAKQSGDLTPRKGESFDWIVGLDVREAFGLINADDVRITHDQARLEITLEPGGDQDDMDWDIRDLDMSVDAVAFVIQQMLRSWQSGIAVSFPYLDLKGLTGGVAVITAESITIRSAEDTIRDIDAESIPF